MDLSVYLSSPQDEMRDRHRRIKAEQHAAIEGENI